MNPVRNNRKKKESTVQPDNSVAELISNGMNPQEHVPLAPFTTFHIGGPARVFIEAQNEKDIEDAIALARERGFPLHVLGGGSNILVPDAGVDGIVLRVRLAGIAFESDGADTLLVASAGESWDAVVDAAGARGIFGIENLAGIPGTSGGAAVQNIGAYGAELADVFEYADTIDRATGAHARIGKKDAALAYRTSFFKHNRDRIITKVALRFPPGAAPDISYPDLVRARSASESLATPVEIARAVRAIRAKKFPRNGAEGTAGSFFKNPVLSRELADSLRARFPDLPVFPQADGRVKVALAWLLDHALSLKGYAQGPVRLYENQPLVIVASAGAHARDVDALARYVAERVQKELGISIEREVEPFGAILFL